MPCRVKPNMGASGDVPALSGGKVMCWHLTIWSGKSHQSKEKLLTNRMRAYILQGDRVAANVSSSRS